MNKDQLNKDFLSAELLLKMHSELTAKDFEEKIRLVQDYARSQKASWDEDVLQLKLNHEVGYIYYEAAQFASAITYLEKVVHQLSPSDHDLLYFLDLSLLVKSNLALQQFDQAKEWIEKALAELSQDSGIFQRLSIMEDYAEYLQAAGDTFADGYVPLLDGIVDELGFDKPLPAEPPERLALISRENAIWNRKLMKIELQTRHQPEKRQMALNAYLQKCEIAWYRDYARQSLEKLT
jgi:tetratricopeptide (TPR) repeat protein